MKFRFRPIKLLRRKFVDLVKKKRKKDDMVFTGRVHYLHLVITEHYHVANAISLCIHAKNYNECTISEVWICRFWQKKVSGDKVYICQ